MTTHEAHGSEASHADRVTEESFSLDAAQSQKVLEALLEISNLVGSDQAIDRILEKIVRITARTMGVEISSIYLWNEDKSRLVMRANVGFGPELVGDAGFDVGQGLPGLVAQTGRIVALADGSEHPNYDPLPSTLEHDLHAYLCAPLRIQTDIVGVMTVRKTVIQDFSESEITIYKTICKQTANVIEKSRIQSAQVEAEKLAAVAVSLSGVAHYIKNVLLAVNGGQYVVEAGLKRGDLAHAETGWKVLKRNIRKIADLVENMLNYYRDSEVHPKPVELNSLVLEVLEGLEDRALEHNTVLTPDLDLRLERVELDPDAMQDAMINLVSNAVDAIPTDRKGLVRVQTRLDHERGEASIRVIDNGCGIAAEDQKKLFNLFYTTKGKNGTGIGLAATKRLIMDHGGSVEFHSTVGEGTEFVVHLPLRQSKI